MITKGQPVRMTLKILASGALLIACQALLAGCQPPPIPSPAPTNPPSMRLGSGPAKLSVAPERLAPLRVDLYQISVPLGAVSRNVKFWKRIDETCVDVATCDLLQKNGIRVGVAPTSEWDYFKHIMEQRPATSKLNTLLGPGGAGQPIELPVRRKVDREELFYFNADNELIGRSYDASENFISMTFLPAPRKTDVVRLALCPTVRAQRKRLEYSMLNEQREFTYVAPERIYDLNLCADVPVGSFMVVAPSAEARCLTSIGHNFLVNDGPAEQTETVLLLVPSMKPLELSSAPGKTQ
jgi:hypothetical protein